MRVVLAGLALASILGRLTYVTSAIVGPQNRRSSSWPVLGPETDLEIVNKVIAPDGHSRW